MAKEKESKYFWSRSEILTELLAIVLDQFGSEEVNQYTVTEKTSYGERGLNLDSIESFELVTEIKLAFDVTIPDEEIEKLVSVGQTADFIANLLKKDGRLTDP